LPRPSALAIVRAPRHRLLVVCTAVLATGMLCVLLLNTMISQGAFRQYELELALIHASEADDQLSRQVQLAEAPLEVERRARALGMVPAAAPVFLRLSDGAVLGDPVPAPAQGKVSFAGAPGWQNPKPRASATPSPPAAAQPSGSAAAQPSGAATQKADPTPNGEPAAEASDGATPNPTATPSAGATVRPARQEATP
jgi:hypothetical protein